MLVADRKGALAAAASAISKSRLDSAIRILERATATLSHSSESAVCSVSLRDSSISRLMS
jgi:hypothetical protein